MNEFEMTGRARTHVVELSELGCALHYEAVASFLAMRDAAKADGIDLKIRSGFRDFATQLLIWNAKWRGERALLSRSGQPLNRADVSDADLVDTILSWSAVPGGSRHHWGTDIDVIDASAVPDGYQVKLVSDEFTPNGMFGRLVAWMDAHLSRFGFFQPYRTDRGGVCSEYWHISYAPVAQPALEALSLSVLRQTLAESDMLGKSFVLDRLPEIYTRYLLNIDSIA